MVMKMVLFLGLLCLFLGCLLYAGATDLATGFVSHFVWWIAWGAGGGMVVLYLMEGGSYKHLPGLVLFGILQEVGFARCYGRADCHAFLACAIVEYALGLGWTEYLLQMLIAFTILGCVQACRRNINRHGNLKVPVPLVPYIIVSFLVVSVMRIFLNYD